MLAYSATKTEFLEDAPIIEDLVLRKVRESLNISPGQSEISSWRNSLGNAMANILRDERIPNDSGVAIEYKLNSSRHRIDFLISGKDDFGRENLLIIEFTLTLGSQLISVLIKLFRVIIPSMSFLTFT